MFTKTRSSYYDSLENILTSHIEEIDELKEEIENIKAELEDVSSPDHSFKEDSWN